VDEFRLDALMTGIGFYAAIIAALAIVLAGATAALYRLRSRKEIPMRQAPGSRIALALSDDFAPSDRFAGFVHEQSGASIALIELPFAAFDQLQKLGGAEEAFAAQGIAGAGLRLLPERSGEHIYLRGEQNTQLVDYAKYILIFRESDTTGMVSANIPRAALNSGILTGREIENILASAALRNEAPEAPKLFTLSYLGPFEEDVSLLGTAKGYRLRPGAEQNLSLGLQPLFLVAPSLSVASIPNAQLFAGRSFEQIDQITDKVPESQIELTIAGLHAVETVGRGTDAGTGAAALVYQLIVEARHGGYFRLIGLAPDESREFFLKHFRKMAGSFSAS
jgi:hypothetical protein